MAVIDPERYDLKDIPHLEGHTWSGVANGDTGKPVRFRGFRDMRVQFFGDFGAGTAVFQGTDDPRGDPNHVDHANAVWLTLQDNLGNNISTNVALHEQIMVPALWVRPSLSGGTAGDLTCIVIAGGLR